MQWNAENLAEVSTWNHLVQVRVCLGHEQSSWIVGIFHLKWLDSEWIDSGTTVICACLINGDPGDP